MNHWENMRKKVESDADAVRKKSEKGELISQQEAALVREAELYAQMDAIEKSRKENDAKKEKARKAIEDAQISTQHDPQESTIHETRSVDDVDTPDDEKYGAYTVISQDQFAGILKEEAQNKPNRTPKAPGEKSDWFEELPKDKSKRRDAILSRFPIDEVFIKYENGFPVEDFAVKNTIIADSRENDRIIVSRSGEEVEMRIDELEALVSEKGFIKVSKIEKKSTQTDHEISEEKKKILKEKMLLKRAAKNKQPFDKEKFDAKSQKNFSSERVSTNESFENEGQKKVHSQLNVEKIEENNRKNLENNSDKVVEQKDHEMEQQSEQLEALNEEVRKRKVIDQIFKIMEKRGKPISTQLSAEKWVGRFEHPSFIQLGTMPIPEGLKKNIIILQSNSLIMIH